MEIFFQVNGYWKSNNKQFTNYIICSDTTSKDLKDDMIFYYGMSEEDIKNNMREAENNGYEFVIISYRKI